MLLLPWGILEASPSSQMSGDEASYGTVPVWLARLGQAVSPLKPHICPLEIGKRSLDSLPGSCSPHQDSSYTLPSGSGLLISL